MSSSQTEVILQNLLADSEYSVTVTAISNSSSSGLPSPAVTVRTLPGKPIVLAIYSNSSYTGNQKRHVEGNAIPVGHALPSVSY